MQSGHLVIISPVHWHSTWQSRQALAAEFARRGWTVTYIDPLPKRWPGWSSANRVMARLRGDRRHAGECIQDEIPGVQLLSPLCLPDSIGAAKMLNELVFLPRIVRRVQANRPRVVLIALPTRAAQSLWFQLQPDVSIYQCAWDWANDPYSSGLERVERQIAESVDLIITDGGLSNMERMAAYETSAPVLHLSHGVDYDLFATAQQPPRQTGTPLCAYFGTLDSGKDIPLLQAVSHQYRLRIIGAIRVSKDGFADSTEFIDGVPHAALPALLKDVDVLLLPYDQTAAHNRGVFPAKTYECLATGKPIVSIGLPSLTPLAHLIDLCETRAEFLAAIANAQTEPPEKRQQRIQHAQANTWQRKAAQLMAEIPLTRP